MSAVAPTFPSPRGELYERRLICYSRTAGLIRPRWSAYNGSIISSSGIQNSLPDFEILRAQCEDMRVITTWFNFAKSTVAKYGILDEDIYNFDETGFVLGLTATAKVVTRTSYGWRAPLQPGNRQWVTAIKAITASGWVLPPCVISKARVFMKAWFADTDLPKDWLFAVSDNGWITDAIGLEWLQMLSIPSTTSRRKKRYRLLIVDGHSSHLSPQFDQICADNDIIPICMPAHSSHILQPLNIDSFVVFKQAYSKVIEPQFYSEDASYSEKSEEASFIYQETRCR